MTCTLWNIITIIVSTQIICSNTTCCWWWKQSQFVVRRIGCRTTEKDRSLCRNITRDLLNDSIATFDINLCYSIYLYIRWWWFKWEASIHSWPVRVISSSCYLWLYTKIVLTLVYRPYIPLHGLRYSIKVWMKLFLISIVSIQIIISKVFGCHSFIRAIYSVAVTYRRIIQKVTSLLVKIKTLTRNINAIFSYSFYKTDRCRIKGYFFLKPF